MFDCHSCTPVRFWHLDKGSRQEGWSGNPLITEESRGSEGGSPGQQGGSILSFTPAWLGDSYRACQLIWQRLPFGDL